MKTYFETFQTKGKWKKHTTLISLLRISIFCHFGSTSFVLPIRPEYGIEDCTWNPGIYYALKSRSNIIYIRESDVISSTGEHLHVGTPNDRSTATGPVTRYRHFDLVSFSSDQVASHWSWEDGTAIRGVLGYCPLLDSFVCGG